MKRKTASQWTVEAGSTVISNKAITLFFLFGICLVLGHRSMAVEFAGGTGEPDNPYRIATAEQLIAIGQDPNLADKHYSLMADIDLDPNLPGGRIFSAAVIAECNGSFEGNGFRIHNLTVEGQSLLGLFGRINGSALVQNLGLVNARIYGSGDAIGILAGMTTGTIINCHSTGSISGDTQVGGLVGDCPFGSIVDCHSVSTVQGEKAVGGLIGSYQYEYNAGRGRGTSTRPHSSIGNCYSRGSINGLYEAGGLIGASNGPGQVNTSTSDCAVTGYDSIGGLMGTTQSRITDCYSMGRVEGDDFVGGLIGNNQGLIDRCYSAAFVSGEDHVGGLTGNGRASNSFWDIDRSTQTHSAAGVGLTTPQMMDPYWYGLSGWANDSIWTFDPGKDTPRLAWEGAPGQSIPEPVIDWMNGSGQADDPYQITNTDQLVLISMTSLFWDKHFILTSDIDMDPGLPGGQVFTQAVIPEFSGSFNGNHFTISNLAMRGDQHLGFFGSVLPDAQINQLGIVNAYVTGTGYRIAGLASNNRGSIRSCHISATINGYRTVGGLVGTNSGHITACHSTGSVTGGYEVGGFVGKNNEHITNCYTTSLVNGDRDTGGFVGTNDDQIENCYSAASASGGGVLWFVGSSGRRSEIISCFWELPSSSVRYTGGVASLNTAEMQTRSTFTDAGWDFTTSWSLCDGSDYPRLQWENVECGQ
jgi:hypothetical protein